MKEVHFYVFGRVQGVGYRAWCVRQAKTLGLSGWVRNRADGSVEVKALGEDVSLNIFLSECKKGPLWAHVKSLQPIAMPNALQPEIVEGVFLQKPTV